MSIKELQSSGAETPLDAMHQMAGMNIMQVSDLGSPVVQQYMMAQNRDLLQGR